MHGKNEADGDSASLKRKCLRIDFRKHRKAFLGKL
jgi:hypothetical protein